MSKIISLICLMLIAQALAECSRSSAPVGVGVPLHGCSDGFENSGSLCYKVCDETFWAVGPVCYGPRNASYSRGVGIPLGCTSDEIYSAGLCYKCSERRRLALTAQNQKDIDCAVSVRTVMKDCNSLKWYDDCLTPISKPHALDYLTQVVKACPAGRRLANAPRGLGDPDASEMARITNCATETRKWKAPCDNIALDKLLTDCPSSKVMSEDMAKACEVAGHPARRLARAPKKQASIAKPAKFLRRLANCTCATGYEWMPEFPKLCWVKCKAGCTTNGTMCDCPRRLGGNSGGSRDVGAPPTC